MPDDNSTDSHARLKATLDHLRGDDGARLIEVCYAGHDAHERLAGFARDRFGRRCCVVSDENTRCAAGEPVLSALGTAGRQVVEKQFGGDSIDATDVLVREVMRAGADSDFYVAVGSGTICDLAKYAAHESGKPVLLFATAASMNGYTSGIAALEVRGVKRTLPCAPAIGVFADPGVLCAAPRRMTAAGVADCLSKYSASADWRTAHRLRGEPFDEGALAPCEGSLEQILAAADGAGRGDAEAVAGVFEGLLLSGLAMLSAGSSSPASGGEHLISHYIDMKSSLYGTPHDLHGAQVGVATIHCLGLWQRVLALDPAAFDAEALADAQPAGEQIREWIAQDWGPVSEEVLEQWRGKELDRSAMRAELERIRTEFGALREAVGGELAAPEKVDRAVRSAGGPTDPSELACPEGEYRKALRHARFIRSRFTVLDLAAELGVTQ